MTIAMMLNFFIIGTFDSMKKIFVIALSLCFSCALRGQNLSFWKPVRPEFDSLVMRMEEKYQLPYYFETIETSLITKMLYGIANQSHNKILLSRAMFWDAKGRVLLDSDSALILLDKAISLTDTLNYRYDYARMLFVRAEIYRDQGKLSKAYYIFNDLGHYFVKCNDKFFAAKTFLNLGTILKILKLYSESNTYLQKANFYFENAGMKMFAVKNKLNISNVLFNTGETNNAIHILKSLAADSACRKDTLFFINTLFSLTSFATNNDDYMKYAKETFLLAKCYSNVKLLIRAYLNLGTGFLKINSLDSASYSYYKAKHLIFKYRNNDIEALRILYGGLAKVHEKQQQWDSAYYYSGLFYAYNDSLIGASKVSEISRIHEAAEIQHYELKMQQAQLQKKIWVIIIVALSCITFFLFMIINIQRKKSHTEKQLKQAETRELNQQLKNEVLQKEQFQMEVDFKNRELASTTLISVKTNQVLGELFKQIEVLGNDGVLPKEQELILKNRIKEQLHSGDYWESFKLHFDKVHPAFFQGLKDKHPTLTENELRLCAYIRIGMTSKQIAQVLSVLQESVHTSRYRLRKAIGLETSKSIEDYLRSL